MSKPEFDQHAENYDRILNDSIPAALNDDNYFAEYKIALMAEHLKGLKTTRILDFGCGAGRSLPYLAKHFPGSEIWGYDVSQESLEIASKREPTAHLFSDWTKIADINFDVIVAANVFHHIPPEQRQSALAKCYANLDENGQFYLFEHNPYNPATRWVFERCPLDINAEMINPQAALKLAKQVGFFSAQHAYTLFFPRQLAFLRRLESILKRVPLGAQYYIKMKKIL
ncbi:putative S-adenosyl-L-methionine (SAM)-dependent methyltransferase [Pusillimonas sp. T7-7]|uniref:class I SAM-dependent methyltransferase n=1 Tax=Pusillimonas sp. (strain T7-7) TaxID=1007105 RepID=UPI0002084CF8|nr:class I SAM-dependent methyltransferase [Pusillimonas sp. T7-7]AEC21724.1 putative S-adenosyl-L-methionine (SAM)-dependent methyltransferase [Pusillimonas sp. T7-7]